MSIETTLRKGLMWKSRLKWIVVGFMVGFIFGSFSWGANAQAQSCTGDPIAYDQYQDNCWLTYGTASTTCVANSNCEWDGTGCTISSTICANQNDQTDCENVLEAWGTTEECVWSGTTTTEVVTSSTTVEASLFGLNVAAAFGLVIAMMFLFFAFYKKS